MQTMAACLDDNAMAAYLDGALTADEITRVDSHLSECAACRKDMSAIVVSHTMPVARETATEEDASELIPGDSIGRYVLSAEHVRGGMGIVAVAFDPELGRNIAIKVLRPELSAHLLREEARAMAKLSHPNVVSVYDVGEHGGRIYFAMELVEGANLRHWLAQERRGWREIMRTCIQAGRGLAAAHRSGLVHRDFKPDNVMCGPDDRVRVTDFGLASSTPKGGIAGTPTYMAPEVWRGEPATRRSDQWSFCATLYEALFGDPPFDGTDRDQVRAAIERGALAFPKGVVHAKVKRTIARGLANDPAARYASLDALLGELESVLRRPRPVWLAAGATAIVMVGGIGLYAMRERPDVCRIPSALIEGAWSDSRARALDGAFAASGRKHAAASARHVRKILDDYATQWLAARHDACAATRIRGDQSELLLDARTRCLDRRRDELAELVRVLGDKPTPEVVDRAVQAALELYPVDTCSAAGVQAEQPLPADREKAARITELDQELGKLRASLVLARDVSAATKQARSLIERARTLNYPPLSARAAIVLAKLSTYSTDHADTERRLYDALVATAAAQDDYGTASVWMELIAFTAGVKGDAAAALQLVKPAEAALTRAGTPARLATELRHAHGTALAMQGKYEDARKAFEQARADEVDALAQATIDIALSNVELRLGKLEDAHGRVARAAAAIERELGPHHPHVGFSLLAAGNMALEKRDDPQARVAIERALAILADSVGERHVAYALGINNLGMIDAGRMDFAAARKEYERAASILEAIKHPDLYLPISNLGNLERRIGNAVASRKYWERAFEIATASHSEQSDRVSRALYSLGTLANDAGDLTKAISLYQRALDISIKLYGEAHPQSAEALDGLGFAYMDRDDCKQASIYQARAVAAFEAVYGREHPSVAAALTSLGHCQLELRDRRALESLERALAIYEHGASVDPFENAATRWTLAQALRKLGGDRARSIALAKQARELYAKSPEPQAKEMPATIDRWLKR